MLSSIKDTRYIKQFFAKFFKKKRLNRSIKSGIIHYTGMQSEIESIKRLKSRRRKSGYYLIKKWVKLFEW